jgi:hypothetical protein
MALDQPVLVVGLPEGDQGEAKFLDGPEGPDPEQVRLQRPDEPFGGEAWHATGSSAMPNVALRGADEGGRGSGAEPGGLALEVAGHVLAAVVVADGEAFGGGLVDAAEALGDALPDRLQRLVPGAVKGGADADAFGRSMIAATKTATWPCSTASVTVMAVPHMVLIVSGMIVPSWLRGPRGRPGRIVAWRPFSHQAADPLLRRARRRFADRVGHQPRRMPMRRSRGFFSLRS